jgi:hypothetical protein
MAISFRSPCHRHSPQLDRRTPGRVVLNPVPLQDIYERWIAKFESPRLKALGDLKRRLEKTNV